MNTGLSCEEQFKQSEWGGISDRAFKIQHISEVMDGIGFLNKRHNRNKGYGVIDKLLISKANGKR